MEAFFPPEDPPPAWAVEYVGAGGLRPLEPAAAAAEGAVARPAYAREYAFAFAVLRALAEVRWKGASHALRRRPRGCGKGDARAGGSGWRVPEPLARPPGILRARGACQSPKGSDTYPRCRPLPHRGRRGGRKRGTSFGGVFGGRVKHAFFARLAAARARVCTYSCADRGG